uniref:Uncharacterized protein n=1 Tax=Arundo donax TaxID=35708 RepID=A0A0A9AW07_ARUDO
MVLEPAARTEHRASLPCVAKNVAVPVRLGAVENHRQCSCRRAHAGDLTAVLLLDNMA